MSIESLPEDAVPPPPETFASYLPEEAATLEASSEPLSDTLPEIAGEAPRKRVKLSPKMRRSMNKLKSTLAQFPIMWFHNQATEHPEWELDKDEQDMLSESIELVFDVLDVEFEIQPLAYTFKSIWWVLSYPFLVFGFLFLTKKSSVDAAHPEEPQP